MMKRSSTINQQILIHGTTYSAADLDRIPLEISGITHEYLDELVRFLEEWFADSPFVQVQTSGSTGAPKMLTVRKTQMIHSASLTCSFLNLQPQDTALLCMPLQYIAGKMMVVRALTGGLNLLLRTPSGHPLSDETGTIQFAAMIPLQVYNSLQNPEERERLSQINRLIIGGGAIDSQLEHEIRTLPNAIYSTYGMTETLSHIALRKLNGRDASPFYHPFESIKLSLSTDRTLQIEVPGIADGRLTTNDVAQLNPDGSFRIIGRKDNIVNSGGIKIQLEEVENELKEVIDTPFAVTAVPDEKFGESLVLLIEQPEEIEAALKNKLKEHLPKYHQPKQIQAVDRIPQTGSGKVDRTACRKLAETLTGTIRS